MADEETRAPSPKSDIMRDIFLWKRKKLALSTLFVSTATWVLLNAYGFNFVTMVSWTAMAAVVMLFLWGNLLRLLSKGEPELSRMEVSEEFAVEAARACLELAEEAIRWMFRVSQEREWFVFGRTVLGLAVLSYIGNLLDFQTSLFIGSVTGLTGPIFWEKNKGRIRKLGDELKERSKRAYEVVHEKIVAKTKKKKLTEEEKEKKTE